MITMAQGYESFFHVDYYLMSGQGKTIDKTISIAVRNPELVEERHNQIFKAALKLFSGKGYHGTTLRELSRESGIGLGSLYNYIGKKTDILSIVYSKLFETVSNELEKIPEQALDPTKKLEMMIKSELEIIYKYSDLIMLVYQESHAMEKASMKSMLSAEERHLEYYKKILDEGKKAGVFATFNTTAMAHLIKAMIDCWVLKRWALRNRVSLKEMTRAIIQIVYDGILKPEMPT